MNESLCQHSPESVDIDEFGQVEAPSYSNGESSAKHTSSGGRAYLTAKYRALWEDTPHNFLLEEDAQVEEYLSNLAATGLMGYPSDISGEWFDELPEDRIPSELHQSEMQLVGALPELHTRYHGWRMLAEEEIGIQLDELLQITRSEYADGNISVVTHSIPAVSQQLCENTPSVNQ